MGDLQAQTKGLKEEGAQAEERYRSLDERYKLLRERVTGALEEPAGLSDAA